MTERSHIIVAIVLLLILVGAIVYAMREGQKANAPVTTLTPKPASQNYDTATVRASHSYRLEDNMSVPSQKTVPAE